MKTPSYLPLLLLSAALPASAELKAGDRCDTAFLDKVSHDFAAGGIVTDADRIVNKTAGGVTLAALKFNEPKTCDAATWRHLASGSPLSWRNAEAQRWWDKSNAGPNASLLLVVSDFYKAIDPRAAEVNAAADAVIEAGAQLGFVTVADGAKSLSETLKGASGGPIGALKPKTVTAAASEAKATIGPEQVGPTLRKLIDEKGGKGAGDAVLRFRVAVLALNAQIGYLGATDTSVVKRAGLAMPTAKDFLPGLPKEYVAAKADKATALDDAKYASGLAALVGAGKTPALDDAGARPGALLDSVDLGLRNLVAIRSAQVDQIVAAAKKSLGGKTITDKEVKLRAVGEAGKASNPLAAAVLQKLAQTPEYARLDALYENNKREKGDAWVNSTNGKAVFEEREKMKQAALSARIETVNGQKAVVYTQGGKTTSLGSLVPSKVEKEEAARDDAAEVISRFIVDGATGDAKYQGVVAAVGGSGQPGAPLDTGIKGPEVPVSKDVPPATKKIRDGAAGCESPKDLIRNDYETYAARKRSAAADMASANVKSRNDVEKKRLEAQEASDEKCKAKKEEALSIKSDYFDSPAVAKEARRKAFAEAEAWCADDKKAIDAAAAEKISALAAREKGDRDPAKLRAEADADLAAAFGVAVMGSIEKLRKDYTTPGNPRITCNPNQVDCTEKANFKLTEITHGSKKLTTFTALWFATEWPTDPSKKAELEAAVATCSKALGLGDQDDSPSYHNPDDPDNVDEYCKVNAKITKYILDVKGMNKPVP